MATFLLRKNPARQEDGNSSCFNACLANGADEAAARAAANAAAPTGETRVPPSWLAVQLSASDLPAGLGPVAWVDGEIVAPGEMMRGGSVYA